MKGFEEFLKNWSNTVSFFMQFLAIVTNGVVAYVVFRISQNVLKKKMQIVLNPLLMKYENRFAICMT